MRLTHAMPRVAARRRALGLAGLLAAGACAGAPGPAAPSPADIPALEARRAQSPDDPAANLRLGEAYYSAQRYPDARQALARTLLHEPGNAEAQVYLGYTYEGLGQFDSARAVYQRLEAAKPSGAAGRLLQGRLTLVERHQMIYDARQALAHESTLVKAPPPPNTVAVMPFRYTGTDSTYRPLSRGLAAMVVTDLSRVHSLRLVERDRLQALLDEMKLSESGRVDPATGARSGHLIGASTVVQGQYDVTTTQIRMNATAVRTQDAQVASTGTGADRLQALFDLEKQVVFQLLDKLGIAVTPAERVAISERPTHDIEAFLLYSRGLAAQDQGDYAAAAQDFQAAVQRDPGFAAAGAAAQTSEQAQSASTATASTVVSATGVGTGPTTTLVLSDGVNTMNPTGAGSLTPSNGGVTGPGPGGVPTTRTTGSCELNPSGCGGQTSALLGILIIVINRP